MNHQISAYGLWSLVIINAVVFIGFAFSFYHRRPDVTASSRPEPSLQQEGMLIDPYPTFWITMPFVLFFATNGESLCTWPFLYGDYGNQQSESRQVCRED